MDEGNRLGGGHAAIHVLPAALAVAEERGSSGKEFLESVIAGYEVTSHIGTGTKVKKTVHSHGTWGTIGSAVATAQLLGFDQAPTTGAINIAASLSPAHTRTPCLEDRESGSAGMPRPISYARFFFEKKKNTQRDYIR